jgi:hypothetical protein
VKTVAEVFVTRKFVTAGSTAMGCTKMRVFWTPAPCPPVSVSAVSVYAPAPVRL